ncbi:MAG TPA: transporter, partial [Thermoanaerobaculia bacterium]|nr:transporter [Thermoanaerobaculia bacterium]
ILIENGGATPSAFGFGDLDFAAKWKVVEETPGSKRPAFTVNAAVEFPTGSEKKQLGSGLADYGVNLILQKSLSPVTLLHVNAGVQFAGNTQTGVVGIHTPGHILSSGVSVTRDFSPALHLGIDLNGAEVHDGGPKERQLQLTLGGNYAFTSDDTFDFAVLVGWEGAPRVGFLVGVSVTP